MNAGPRSEEYGQIKTLHGSPLSAMIAIDILHNFICAATLGRLNPDLDIGGQTLFWGFSVAEHVYGYWDLRKPYGRS